MLEATVYIIAEGILYGTILETISYQRMQNKRYFKIFFWIGLLLVQVLLPKMPYQENISLLLWIVGMFLYLCFTDNETTLLYNFSMAMSAMMLETVSITLLSIFDSALWFILQQFGIVLPGKVLLACVEILFSIFLFCKKEKLPFGKWYESQGVRVISVIIGTVFAVLKLIGIHSYAQKQHYFGIAVAGIFFFCILLGTLWLIDHYRLALQKQKAEQDSRRMNANLHRTKELMPLLISVVNENKELLDPQIVEEFQQIYSEQMITERKENMNYKFLGSTGIKLLDAQLQHYIMECGKKGIVMDVFVTEPIRIQLQKMEIAQLMMHNMVGDLLRNAIRAIEKNGTEGGKILLILGMKEDCLELDVYDNGSEIPKEVLKRFGERGVTFGGTGNGLADLENMLKDYHASLRIQENAPGSSAYTKGFCIIFNGKEKRELVTYRDVERKSEFWEVCHKE